MPGIFGFVSEKPLANATHVARAMGALLSSHPDQRSTATCGDRWALGATWIPGLQADPGPAIVDGSRWSIATGEVYPSGESPVAPAASPRAAILRALDAGDPSTLARLNGQFSGAVIDLETHEVSVVCDRYALHPIYWVARNGVFAFASEAKGLLAVPGVGQELDPEGLAAFLLIGEHFSDTTALAGVKAAPAASRLRSAGRTPAIDVWWRVRFTGSLASVDPGEAAREAGRLFRRSVERQSAGAERIGVPLSGGLDSRICLAAVPPQERARVTTFTWGDPGCLDRTFARSTARACGVPHLDFDYRYDALVAGASRGAWITDGVAGATDFHILSYLGDLAERSDVILNGFAGDVVLGGNFHWRGVRRLPSDRLAGAILRKRNDALPMEEIEASLGGSVLEAARDLPASFSRAFEHHRQEDPLGTMDAFLLDSRIRRWTSFGTQLLRSRLVSRAPFYDNDFFDFLACIPPDWRTEHAFYRRVLLQSFPDVARTGWQTTGFPAAWPPQVFRPLGTVVRRGLGVVERLTGGRIRSPYPVARLARAFRGPLAARIQADLFGSPGLHWEVFDRAAGERVWRELQAGADGRAKLVGVLLCLRFFLEQGQLSRWENALDPAQVQVAIASP